ncbi:hypothetical protein L1887_38608 [Cichorium endivia]|nr:hypothetical protein L1887_38608 [Cichorium endivia]
MWDSKPVETVGEPVENKTPLRPGRNHNSTCFDKDCPLPFCFSWKKKANFTEICESFSSNLIQPTLSSLSIPPFRCNNQIKTTHNSVLA